MIGNLMVQMTVYEFLAILPNRMLMNSTSNEAEHRRCDKLSAVEAEAKLP